jgi:hypothetical protein
MNGYLIYEDYRNYRGILHCLSNLRALIMEATYFNRIPVVSPPMLDPKHNFGIKLNSHWSKYLNLSQTEVYFKDNSKFEQMPNSFSFIFEEDFKHLDDIVPVYKINAHHKITEDENKNYKLIVRSVSYIKYGWWLYAVPSEIQKKVSINFALQDDIPRISKTISERLGWYAAIRVRRGDRLKDNKKQKKFTSPKHILKTAKDIVPLQSNLYILTNEKNRDFFDYLRKYYRIYQYFDFDELKAIVHGQEPDNNFLFLIELSLFDNAAKRIETFKWPGAENYFFFSKKTYYLSPFTWTDFSINFKLKLFIWDKSPLIFKRMYDRIKSIISISLNRQ